MDNAKATPDALAGLGNTDDTIYDAIDYIGGKPLPKHVHKHAPAQVDMREDEVDNLLDYIGKSHFRSADHQTMESVPPDEEDESALLDFFTTKPLPKHGHEHARLDDSDDIRPVYDS